LHRAELMLVERAEHIAESIRLTERKAEAISPRLKELFSHSRLLISSNLFQRKVVSKEITMKQSNVVKCFALVCALSMPMAAFAAGTGTGAGGAGTGAAGTGAAGTGGASTGAPGAGTAGTGGPSTGGPGAGTGNSTNPAAATEPQEPAPPNKPTGIK
jgi:hypothetical protein